HAASEMSLRDIALLISSVGLPWLAGMLAVLTVGARRHRLGWLLAIAYGYPIGAFVATLLLRLLSAVGIHWALPMIALPMVALIGLLLWPARASLRSRPDAGDVSMQSTLPLHVLYFASLALIVTRLAGLALEIAWRPLLPWDAWAHWGTKTKVWF